MNLQNLITLQAGANEAVGTTVSPIYRFYADGDKYTWAVDVDLGDGSDPLKCVPIATNNKEVFYADQGKPVALRKENGHWVVIGLSKTVKSWQHYMYVCFEDDLAEVIGDEMMGYQARLLTYGELGDLVATTGYGYFPYGVMGRFDSDGNLIEIIETRPK